ncbi:MAG: hypothetical protein L3J39_08245 [Verrucomicrobiales bacterium]|nr:hypothetical protein [Verrucomicrobiales bacterium]
MNTAQPSPEKIKILLLNMLSPMRGNQDILLHGEIASQAIAKAAWDEFIPSLSTQEAQDWRHWPLIESALSAEVSAKLCSEKIHSSTPPPTSSPAQWLKHLVDTLREIDHRSLEVLALLIEGHAPRDISERLDIGLRCLQSITHEMHNTWFAHSLNPS